MEFPWNCRTSEPPPEHEDTPSNTGSSRREQRDNEYRQLILTTTRELIESQGIDSVSMYQIAQAAGVGQGTLYRRYTHVGEIYAELLKTTTTAFFEDLESRFNREQSACVQLNDNIVRIIDFIDDKAALLSMINSTFANDKTFKIHKRPIIQQLHNLLSSLVSLAVEQGEIEEIDPALAVNCLLSAIAPGQYRYHREELGYSKEQFIAIIQRIFVQGLQSKKPDLT